jgi:hypothetical protein
LLPRGIDVVTDDQVLVVDGVRIGLNRIRHTDVGELILEMATGLNSGRIRVLSSSVRRRRPDTTLTRRCGTILFL